MLHSVFADARRMKEARKNPESLGKNAAGDSTEFFLSRCRCGAERACEFTADWEMRDKNALVGRISQKNR
jgi:hypothetical protein